MAADVELVKANLLRCGVQANHIEMMSPFLPHHHAWENIDIRPSQAIAGFAAWGVTAEGGRFWEDVFFDYEEGLYAGQGRD